MPSYVAIENPRIFFVLCGFVHILSKVILIVVPIAMTADFAKLFIEI